jgi:site-specific recombinase
MLSSAAGGGLLTAGTVALKCAIAALGLPIFFEGLASSFNYAGSFLLMQALGFTLATKQPAFTAAALAAEMRPVAFPKPGKKHIDVHALVELIARITRSQIAAVAGNLGMVLPAALVLDALSRLVRGRPVLDAEAAHHYVLSLHPTHSGTVVYAALTGLLLWLASLGAGWLENWVVFRRLPEALAGSPTLRRVLGPARARRLGALVLRRFVGAPLEVRHVTLSTGALALAGSALGPTHVLDAAFLSAMLGIALIGLLNFGVSFALALTVALKGREASGKDRLALLRALAARLVRAPLSFVLPPR